MKKRIYILFILSVLICNVGFSQKTNISIALKEYENLSYAESIPKLLELVAKEKNSIKVIERLSNAYYFNGQMIEASKWYSKLLELNSNTESENYFRYAQSLKAQEKYEEASHAMKNFAAIKPEDSRVRGFIKNQDFSENIIDNSNIYELVNLDVNTMFSDFGTSIYKDNLIFASSRNQDGKIYTWNNQPFLDLYKLNSEGDVMEIPGDINTKYHESSTAFTKNGKTVYFTRNNYFKGKFKKNSKETHVLKIYKGKIVDKVWTKIEPLPFNNDEYSVAHPALSLDEKKLYFASDMPGTIGASDIYVVAINTDGTYGKPINLGSKINTEGRENFPFISNKGNLFFSSDGHVGLGGLDVFKIEIDKITDLETEIENLGKPINSSKDDFGFIINETSGKGYISSNREGGKGDDDIYSFEIPNCIQVINGIVKDKITLELIPDAVVTLFDANNNKLETVTVGVDAAYVFKGLSCDMQYYLKVAKNGYLLKEKIFNTSIKEYKPDENFLLEKETINTGSDLFKSLSLESIYFNYNEVSISPDAEIKLSKIINYMKEFPNLKLDVKSYSDSRGRDTYNLELSNKRNKSTRDYIINNGGISKDRVTGKGYGERQLKNHCSNGVKCSKEEHQANRRSEFIVVEN
jgi:outer membrane protein OmpA-like peptidoglycan-associated protein/tetratricopeptide (TPR) repeat protein